MSLHIAVKHHLIQKLILSQTEPSDHIAAQGRGQVVEALGLAVHQRIPARRIDVAGGIEAHGVFQRGHTGIVKVGRTQGDVAQRGHLELAAQLGARGQVCALGATQAHVEEGRVGIGADGRVAGQAQRGIAEVGEQRPAAIGGHLAGVAAVAVAAAIEHRLPPGLGGGEAAAAVLHLVELAVEQQVVAVQRLVVGQRLAGGVEDLLVAGVGGQAIDLHDVVEVAQAPAGAYSEQDLQKHSVI